MSLYRFARMSALLAFAGKYRVKIFNMGAAAAFAAITSWLYGDIAVYLQAHHPQWEAIALLVKTVVVYAALFFLLWQLRPARESRLQNLSSGDSGTGKNRTAAGEEAPVPPAPSKLEQLAEKPKLTSRKDAILNK